MIRLHRRRTQLRNNLCASTADGAAFSVNVGLGESYLAAFLLAIGGGQVVAGLVATVPLLAGAVLQLVSPAAIRWFGSLRRWVVLCAAIQAASMLPLAAGALLGSIPVPVVFLIAALYWGAGMATGPAWNTWIGTIVPTRVRARYFAWRSRIAQVAVLAGLLLGGMMLEAGSSRGIPLRAFALLFAVAGFSRLVSVGFLARQSEPRALPSGYRQVPALELLRRLRHGRDARLLSYLLAIALAANIAAPFFTPYMLRELGFSYAQYMTLIATAFATKILSLPALGAFAHRFGADRLLWLGGLGIVPLAGLWIVSDAFVYLLGVQMLAGAAWGAYELGTFLMTFETIREEERTSLLTTFNFANAIAVVSGSLLGGALLGALAESHFAYEVLFGVSSLARAAAVVLLMRLAPVVFRTLPMAIRVLAVRPSAGSLDRPILPSIPHGEAHQTQTPGSVSADTQAEPTSAV